MPNALTFLVGADTAPFQKEMAQLERLSAERSRSIAARVTQGGHGAYGGVIRESITLGREVAEGRSIGRLAGSFSLLLQQLGRVGSANAEAGGAARVAAEEYDLLALRQSEAARRSLALASSLDAEVMANEAATEADVNGAIAAREKSIADERSALALRAKAIAASNAAEAEDAEAAASGAGGSGIGMGVILPVVAAVAAVGLAIYERFSGFQKAVAASTPPVAEMANDYIPQMARHAADAQLSAEGLANAVQRAGEEYEGANAAAERQSQILQEQYNHLKKLSDLRKEKELATARTPAQRQEIERRYAADDLRRNQQQHRDELAAMDVQAAQLDRQKQKALSQKRVVSTRAEDEQLGKNLDAQKQAAEAFLKGGGAWEEFKKNIAVNFSASSEADQAKRQKLLEDTEAGGVVQAQGQIKNANEFKDKQMANEKIRKENERLQKEAEAAAAGADTVRRRRRDAAGRFTTQEQDDAEETQARLDAEQARDNRQRRGSGAHNEVSAAQRIGFSYVAAAQDDTARSSRETARNTGAILRHLNNESKKSNRREGSGFDHTRF